MDEDALMRRVADGDTQAFGHVVRAHQARLMRFATRLLGDPEAAQDAVQEAFLRLWRLRTAYQTRGCLQAYLLRAVRTICLDYARAARPWESLSETEGDDGPAPSAQAEAHGLADAVARAVASLPEGQRAVFVLSQYEGLTYAEIADVLECPIGTVASRKHQATETLRRKLSAWKDEP